MESLHNIIALLEEHWIGKRILVLGDIMLDKYIHGTVERISPEAPVPVVHAVRRSQSPGGAANVAMNIVGMNGNATLIGFTGGDNDEEQLRQCLLHSNLRLDLISIPGTSTTSKLRILGGGQQMLRLDVESTEPCPTEAYSALLRRVDEVLPDVDGVILSDYAKGVLNEEICRSVINSVRARGLPVFVDPKNRDFSRYRHATTICPNAKELALAAGRSATDLEALLDRGQKMIKALELEYMIVTMGEKGITILQQDERIHIPSVAKQVFDVSGAGDTVIAALSLAIVCGMPVKDAAQLANIAAGIVVSKQGTVPVAHHELVSALTQSPATRVEEKILNFERLVDRCAEWSSAGDKVVFTNGCFDGLHIGHVSLLEKCRSFGARVVVGVRSDAVVRRLKGPLHRVICERDRARMLAALASTDAVVVLDQFMPIDIIMAIRPDVIVETEGGDDTETDVAALPAARVWGGRVEVVSLLS